MSNPTLSRPLRLLALCDSVAANPGQALTGFGRVAHNLFSRWAPPGSGIALDVWGIGFDGHGYKALTEAFPNWTLLPGGNQGWNAPERLAAFLRQLAGGHYTHVFFLMDPDALSGIPLPAPTKGYRPPGGTAAPYYFSDELKRICREQKIRSALYYPVDAPLQPPWDILSAVDVAVTFTDYGQHETRKRVKRDIAVLPHGLEAHFTPVTPVERAHYRALFQVPNGKGGQKPFLAESDFLLVVVDKNEWRKDPLRPLEIVAGLRSAGVPAKLVMRSAPTSLAGGIQLERAAAQLGLTLDVDWAHVGPVPEEHLRGLYGAADLVLKTALGEGWGLSVTEALACGTPVAAPNHTSCREIGARVNAELPAAVTLLALERGCVMGYDTRLRRRVELATAVQDLEQQLLSLRLGELPRVALTPALREWLSWDRVAAEMGKLMGLAKAEGKPV